MYQLSSLSARANLAAPVANLSKDHSTDAKHVGLPVKEFYPHQISASLIDVEWLESIQRPYRGAKYYPKHLDE